MNSRLNFSKKTLLSAFDLNSSINNSYYEPESLVLIML